VRYLELVSHTQIYVAFIFVAVSGLPEARKDHAVTMARFARDCLLKMQELVKKLECTLGPDTCDLTLRLVGGDN